MKIMRNPAKHLWRAVLAMILVVSMLGAASVMCFAETTVTEETTVTPKITNVSVSIGEDIIVKFYTNATTADGSKLTVEFDGNTVELTENEGGVFEFVGVTPQKLGVEMTATFTDAEGDAGVAKTVSVKSYLEGLLALAYEDSGCMSQLQYQAMRELCVNMLNYGAAAQTYVEYDVENLANAGLSDEQKALATEKITVTETDKAVSGAAWIGAGVRFDYKLGLYFVFKAASADEYVATVNGTEVTPEAYEAIGEGYYVIRYSSFNATNMNDVATAKLTKDGSEDQTFSYSIKSYVASKGGDESTIANLVNATYVYGFAAVAYSADYVTVDPTFEQTGSISMDGKGYDFSESKYGTVTLPALNFTDYTAETVNSGTEEKPVVTTTFTLNDDTVAYAKEFTTDSYFEYGGTKYSQYDLARLSVSDVVIGYTDGGYTFTATNVTLDKVFSSYGAPLTVTGTINMNVTEEWKLSGGSVVFDAATITVNSTATHGIRVFNNTILTVDKDSKLDVKGATTASVYLGTGSDTNSVNMLVVDGTVTCDSSLYCSNAYAQYDADKGLGMDGGYGFIPAIYVRNGELTATQIYTQTIQVGNASDESNVQRGTLNLSVSTGQYHMYNFNTKGSWEDVRWCFSAGELNMNGAGNGAYAQTRGYAIIEVYKNMKVTKASESFVFAAGYSVEETYQRNVIVENGADLTGIAGDFQWGYRSPVYMNCFDTFENVSITDSNNLTTSENTVRVFTRGAVADRGYICYNANDNYMYQKNATSTQYHFPAAENVNSLTATGNSINIRCFGTLYEAKLANGTTVYYQIVE